jgi:hypothetical protein
VRALGVEVPGRRARDELARGDRLGRRRGLVVAVQIEVARGQPDERPGDDELDDEGYDQEARRPPSVSRCS